MNTSADQKIQRVIEIAAVLVAIGMGLNIVVMQTLGSFDAAVVILGLFIGFWAILLGLGILVVSTGLFVFERTHAVSERKPESAGLQPLQPCRC